jgi:hypothetical protein
MPSVDSFSTTRGVARVTDDAVRFEESFAGSLRALYRGYLRQRESPALPVRRERSDHSRNRTPNRAGVNRARSTESSTAASLILSLQRVESNLQNLCVGC